MNNYHPDIHTIEGDNYLLKIRQSDNTGFLSQLTQKGQIPKRFTDWPTNYGPKIDSPIYFHTEIFQPNWKIKSFRFGESQNWATLIHPLGFSLEIYMTNLLEIIKTTTIINGQLQGSFKWQNNKLIQYKEQNEHIVKSFNQTSSKL